MQKMWDVYNSLCPVPVSLEVDSCAKVFGRGDTEYLDSHIHQSIALMQGIGLLICLIVTLIRYKT